VFIQDVVFLWTCTSESIKFVRSMSSERINFTSGRFYMAVLSGAIVIIRRHCLCQGVLFISSVIVRWGRDSPASKRDIFIKNVSMWINASSERVFIQKTLLILRSRRIVHTEKHVFSQGRVFMSRGVCSSSGRSVSSSRHYMFIRRRVFMKTYRHYYSFEACLHLKEHVLRNKDVIKNVLHQKWPGACVFTSLKLIMSKETCIVHQSINASLTITSSETCVIKGHW
jgi:hypothetical protein